MFSPKRSQVPEAGFSKPSRASRRSSAVHTRQDQGNNLWQILATHSRGAESEGLGPAIQAKLTVGAPGDKYEQEADRVADQVTRMPEAGEEVGIQRKAGPTTAQRMCTGCEEELQRQSMDEEEPATLQMSGKPGRKSGGPPVSDRTGSKIRSVQSGGEPLSSQARSHFEPRFGRDFQNVRIQRDSRANTAAAGLSARAFTVGNNITFAAGQFRPDTSDGRRLLAHELTHVVQQTSGSPREPRRQRESTNLPGNQILQRSPPQISRQESDIKDDSETFIQLNGLSMADMLEKFAAMDEADLDFLIKHVNKYKAKIHEERMLAALLVEKHRGSFERQDFAKAQSKLLSNVNADQVSLILDHLSKSSKRKTEINIYFNEFRKEADGFDEEMYALGHLNFYKKGKLTYSTAVSGGGHKVGLTDSVTGRKIHRKEGGNHKSSNGNVPMAWPIYFKGLQAIHQGALDHASMSCVHVPDITVMEKIHRETVKHKTIVNIYYKQSVLDKLCPLREQVTGRKINPCK